VATRWFPTTQASESNLLLDESCINHAKLFRTIRPSQRHTFIGNIHVWSGVP
jgi:hypothetical protein